MNWESKSTAPGYSGATSAALAVTAAAVLLTMSALAFAQGSASPDKEPDNFFSAVGHWFGRQADNIGASFKDAGKGVENFGHEAGVAAKTTVDGAKGAADAMVRIPQARVISVHEKCKMAANGAPDCLAVSSTACKAQGFESGKSVDMTTAETCPPQVYLSGRSSGPECRTETFVSRILCQ